jgi:Holliday junction resolvase RusA-like endonuclease
VNTQIRIVVPGTPAPQGSKIAGVTKLGTIYLREASGTKLYDWRDTVAWQASIQANQQGWGKVNGAVAVAIEFYLQRPKTVKRDLPSVKPDLDKLVRSTFDGLTQSGSVWGDDAQVCRLIVAKDYTAEDQPAGAVITIRSVSRLERVIEWLKTWTRAN